MQKPNSLIRAAGSCGAKSTGKLAKGCELCIKGLKSVLFITGLCSESCYYCPVADNKIRKDVCYINEMPVKKNGSAAMSSIINEIRLCGSKGVGITGGDPLLKIRKTAIAIRELKKELGKSFHIHLYAPLKELSYSKLKALGKAGLDELRLHPRLEKKQEWKKIRLASGFGFKLGIEIPAIPGKEARIKELIGFLSEIPSVSFINLNELELSDTNANSLLEMKFRPKDCHSYAVKGSESCAKAVLSYCRKIKPGFSAYYCTAKLKDSMQLKNRLKRRAENIKQSYDIVTEDGILVRGAVFGNTGKEKPSSLISEISGKLKLSTRLFKPAPLKARKKGIILYFPAEHSAAIKKAFPGLKIAIVEDYPTWDCMNVETTFL